MQEPGIEPGAQRWQRWILPLNHSCELLILKCPVLSDCVARVNIISFLML